jgi:hypothetical protein
LEKHEDTGIREAPEFSVRIQGELARTENPAETGEALVIGLLTENRKLAHTLSTSTRTEQAKGSRRPSDQ